MIDEYARRVREIRSVHARIKAADEARAAERLAFDPSPEADKERRYILSQERLLNQNIATIIKARKAGNDGILVEADTDGGDPFDLAAISPSLAQRTGMGPAPAEASATDPSLALRAGMGPPAPAEDEPIHTSPTRQRGACEIPPQRDVHESSKTVAQGMSQTLSGEASCAEAEVLPNEAGAHFDSAQCRHIAEAAPEPLSPRFVAGTVPFDGAQGRPGVVKLRATNRRRL